MKIYLLRHAIAGTRSATRYPDDRLRPLTDAGRQRMIEAAHGMLKLGLRFDRVLTSPLLRAAQTAEIVHDVMEGPAPRLCAALAPGGAPGAVLTAIGSRRPPRDVLLVGHEPDLTRLASWLILGPGEGIRIDFRKGGLCMIDFDGRPAAGRGALVVLLKPSTLRALGIG